MARQTAKVTRGLRHLHATVQDAINASSQHKQPWKRHGMTKSEWLELDAAMTFVAALIRRAEPCTPNPAQDKDEDHVL